ncbi:MAG TPA: hypothetical protein VNA14_06475 [Mycobacteriales bacterium]|nr:hypothetical protein [Mycobacteriales bacterium]
MSRRTAIVAGLVGVALLLSACAGEPAKRTAPRRPVGHGSVAEVIAALALEKLPCSNPQNQPLHGFEEAVICQIGTTEIAIVHFADPAAQAKPYEDAIRAAGWHGVFGGSWAAKVPTAGLAKRIAGALENTTYV